MADRLEIEVVTFTASEAAAVERLLDDLASPESEWARHGPDTIELDSTRSVRIRHRQLRAQGNVVAAATVTQLFSDRRRLPDLVLFYGCAGAVDSADVGSAFLVGSVSYASLGTVEVVQGGGQGEVATLKNKWMCHVDGADVDPLPSMTFTHTLDPVALDLTIAGLTRCHVMATDKVVRVGPATVPPVPGRVGPPHSIYEKGEWSYSDALAYTVDQSAEPVLVEMEAYGIAQAAAALKLEDRVVVVRIATDDLVGHATSDGAQEDLLRRGRIALLSVLHAAIIPRPGIK